MNKGFTQIAALLLCSLFLASAIVVGGILIKEKEMRLSAQETPIPAEVPTTADLSTPEQSPVSVPISESPAMPSEPIIEAQPEPAPVVSTPTPTPATTPNPEIQEIKIRVEQINEEQVRFNKEQIRQSRCIDVQNLEKQIQTLCHAYNFPGVDKCIQIREKDVQLLKDYIPNDEQRKTGQDESYYAARIQEEQDKVDQMIALKPQYESLKSQCGQ